MQLHNHLMKSVFGKAALAAVLLSGILLFAGAPSAKANDWDDCNHRVAYFGFINRLCISAITARKLHTGGMSATKRMNNWSVIAATSGERANGASMNGGAIAAITTNIATIATGTVIEIETGTETNT